MTGATPVNEAWDWPFLLYVGTVLLRRSEMHFWRMTPNKLRALAKVHSVVNGGEEEDSAQKEGFIDNII